MANTELLQDISETIYSFETFVVSSTSKFLDFLTRNNKVGFFILYDLFNSPRVSYFRLTQSNLFIFICFFIIEFTRQSSLLNNPTTKYPKDFLQSLMGC